MVDFRINADCDVFALVGCRLLKRKRGEKMKKEKQRSRTVYIKATSMRIIEEKPMREDERETFRQILMDIGCYGAELKMAVYGGCDY